MPTPAPTPRVLQARETRSVDDARLNESSGLVASRKFPGFLWTHNDSGDSARVFLLSPQGRVALTVNLQGANAQDWEDIALAKGSVYCGDIGDNERKRGEVQIYRFRESDVQRNATEHTVTCETLTLRYPDGAHDAETLLARSDGSLIIVTKDVGGSGIYASQPFRAGATQTLRKIGSYAFPFDGNDLLKGWRGTLATGGDVSPDGRRLTVLTYTHLYEWRLPRGANAWSRVWKTAPRAYQVPKLRQSEAVCYALDGNWWMSSEGTPMPLLQLAKE